jgi:hemin uptake protein HemP
MEDPASGEFGASEAPPLPEEKRRIDSGLLFKGNHEIIIVHRKEEYHLRITRNGKLILTK